MKIKFKIVLMAVFLGICLVSASLTKVIADGPPYSEVEPNNTIADANTILLYDNVNATLPQGDTDNYKIYIPVQGLYVFDSYGNGCSSSLNMTITDTDNNIIFTGIMGAQKHIIVTKNLCGLFNIQFKDDSNVNNQNSYDFEVYPYYWPDSNIYRFSGADRYGTSFNIFKNNWIACNTAIITTGEKFPDALSAAPLAKEYNAPIILTKPDSLGSDVENQLKATGVKNAFIIGGIDAVSQNIEDELISMGITYTRLAGADRYSTNIAILQYLNPNGEIAVATGKDFPDVLSVAAIAASSGMPILLTDGVSISDKALDYIKTNNIKNSYVIGGTAAVSTNCQNSLSNITIVKRLSGGNRYITNTAVIKYFQGRLKLGNVYYATGLNFPDALSGSVLAVEGKHPIVLIDKGAGASNYSYLKSYNPTNWIFGGTEAVPDSVITNIFK